MNPDAQTGGGKPKNFARSTPRGQRNSMHARCSGACFLAFERNLFVVS
jgi:hypothetical protein